MVQVVTPDDEFDINIKLYKGNPEKNIPNRYSSWVKGADYKNIDSMEESIEDCMSVLGGKLQVIEQYKQNLIDQE